MDISVLIPIYKAEKYIERCLRSLFSQTKTDGVEFILVNDATPDNSMKIVYSLLREYPKLVIKIINHEFNKGSAAARQTGLAAMTGEYTLQVDADDWCEIEMLEQLYRIAIKESADIVCFDYNIVRNNHVKHIKHLLSSTDGIACANSLMKTLDSPQVWNKLIKRTLFIDENVSFSQDINMGEDLLISIKLFSVAKKVAHAHKAFYNYDTRNEDSMCNNYTFQNYREYYELLPCALEQFYKENNYYDSFINELNEFKLMSKYKYYHGSK